MIGSACGSSERAGGGDRWRPLRAGAIAVVMTACAARPLVRDDLAREAWHELRSEHIQLTTDVPVERAVQHVRELEQSWRALNAMYVVIAPWATPPDEPFPVIHLNDCSDFRSIAPERLGAFVFSSNAFFGERVVVTCEHESANHRVLLHELVHILNHRCIPLAPLWVNEGLATYFETMEVTDGRAVIGEPPLRSLDELRSTAWLPSLADVLGFTYRGFHDDHQSRNYASAWKLVHLLNNTSSDYQNRFRGFLAMLNGQRAADDAWATAFRGVPQDRLAEEYRVYHQQRQMRMWTTSYELENPPEATLRRLRPGEAHAVWAHLLTRKSVAAALQQLDLAAKADPEWPDVLYWRAYLLSWLRRPDREEQVKAALRAYRSKRPDDVRGWHMALDLELDRVVPAGHLGVEPTAPAGIEDLEPIALGLVAHAQRPSDLNTAAWYYAMARRADVGLPLAIKSVQRDPGCAGCWDTLALLYFQTGDVARARLAQERAIHMYGDPRIVPSVQMRLERYRAADSVASPASAAAPEPAASSGQGASAPSPDAK